MIMETSIKTLPEMNVICFEAYSADCEIKAFKKMTDWLEGFNRDKKLYRIFGHNIDSKGNITYEPRHAGYKILLYLEDTNFESKDYKTEVIKPGKFLVTSTEGEIENAGKWLMEGWSMVNETIQNENIKVKDSPRWYEEHIKTERSNYIKVDLYVEIE